MNISRIWYLGLGHLLGSIPFALVIGKLSYKTDVRNLGSDNLGGTNVGRVLRKKAGISAIARDVAKIIATVDVISCFDLETSVRAGFAAAFSHCYPVFAELRGGKAVTTMFGFLLSTSIFTLRNVRYLIVPFAVFLVVLYTGKIASLSGTYTTLISSIHITVMQLHISVEIVAASQLLTMLVIYRHRANIIKVENGTGNKISWL